MRAIAALGLALRGALRLRLLRAGVGAHPGQRR